MAFSATTQGFKSFWKFFKMTKTKYFRLDFGPDLFQGIEGLVLGCTDYLVQDPTDSEICLSGRCCWKNGKLILYTPLFPAEK